MLDNLYEVVFLIGLVAGCVIRTACLVRARRSGSQGKEPLALSRQTQWEKPFLLLAFLGMQVLPLVYVLSPWLDAADYGLPAKAAAAAGVLGTVVFAAALWLLWRSHADLGRNWSAALEIRESHSLVTEGVYRRVRHPMYAAHLLWAVAQALLLQNWIAGPAFLASFLPLYVLRVPREERMMLDHFGEEYRSYMRRTGRLIPALWR